MLRVSSIAGLPVIGMEEARTIGRVVGVLVDAAGIKAACLLVQSGPAVLGAHALTLDKVTGIGPDAIAARSIADLKPLREDARLTSLAEQETDIPGAIVYKINGERIGEAVDWSMTPDGRIAGVLLKSGGVLSGKDVLSIGHGIVVVRQCETGDAKALGLEDAPIGPAALSEDQLQILDAFGARDLPVKPMRHAPPEEAEDSLASPEEAPVAPVPLETLTEPAQAKPPETQGDPSPSRVRVKGVDSPYASVVEIGRGEPRPSGVPIVIRRPSNERDRASIPLFPTEGQRKPT